LVAAAFLCKKRNCLETIRWSLTEFTKVTADLRRARPRYWRRARIGNLVQHDSSMDWTASRLYASSKRHYKYWSIRWFDLIPGYNQTLFGSIECQPFFQDPPMHLSTE
jgi:hypothetical protein